MKGTGSFVLRLLPGLNIMNKIESFKVDHTKLSEGIYVSRIDGDITTYDLRFKKPNMGDYLSNSAMHTIEHLMATYLRNSNISDDVIYFGPMGCQTGYYLVVSGTPTVREIIDLLELTLKDAVQITEIPAANETQCGQAKLHDLEGAKRLMNFWLSQDKDELEKVFG